MSERVIRFYDSDGSLWEESLSSNLNIEDVTGKKVEDERKPFPNGESYTTSYSPGEGWVLCLDDPDSEVHYYIGPNEDEPVENGQSYTITQKTIPEGYTVVNPPLPAQRSMNNVLYVSASLILIILSIIVLMKGYIKYGNYDKVSYCQSVETINHFTTYKSFQRSMKWWVWRYRWQYASEISDLFSGIANSPYKDNLLYQYEVIQLFPTYKELIRLLREEKLEQLTKKITRLNQSYWDVEF